MKIQVVIWDAKDHEVCGWEISATAKLVVIAENCVNSCQQLQSIIVESIINATETDF